MEDQNYIPFLTMCAGKTKWNHEGCEMAEWSVGAWSETAERNKRRMNGMREPPRAERRWKTKEEPGRRRGRPMQYAQGLGAGF